MAGFRSRAYQGKGPEIVWVGEGAEVCGLGYESDKYRFLKSGEFDVVSLGLRMGFLLPKIDETGKPLGVMEAFKQGSNGELTALPESQRQEVLLQDEKALEGLKERWKDYLYQHTGIRSIGKEDLPWLPQNYPTHSNLQIYLPEPLINLMKTLGVGLEVGAEMERERGFQLQEELWKTLKIPPEKIALMKEIFPSSKVFEVTLIGSSNVPFPFKVDLGAPLPTGWQKNLLGFSRKETKGMNRPIIMAHEVVYRTLLNACLHMGQVSVSELFPFEKFGLYLGSGIGPHEEHNQMVVDTLEGRPTGAKALANCIVNVAAGYISARIGIKGKISTHVGACETCLGSIANAYRDLKEERMIAAIAGGFDDCMTAASYNGFTSNLAFTTNGKVVQNLNAMLEEGALEDPGLKQHVKRIQKETEKLQGELDDLEKQFKENQIGFFAYQNKKKNLKEEKRNIYMNLPKEVAELASMPFAKYRSGFVMGVGGGGGFFTTLDRALEYGLPIRAFISGVCEMVPDSKEGGSLSIAALGDGVGDAYERAFEECKRNYKAIQGKEFRELKIDDIGVWFAHGTSTPLNGWGERREIERVHKKYGRTNSILITGDKSAVGHRVAGNFPSLVGYMFETNEVLPIGNYFQPGFAPKGRRGFGDSLDQLFPSSRLVGKAGEGGGQAVPYEGNFIAVNGAGFGRINTVLIFRRFRLSEIEGPQEILEQYQDKLAANLKTREDLKKKILFGLEPLVR